MAISQMFAGTAHHALTGNLSLTAPAQATAGSLCFLVVNQKRASGTAIGGPGLSGWTLLTSQNGGGTTHGQSGLRIYYRVPVTSIAGQTFTITGQDTEEDDNFIGQIFCFQKDPSDGAWVTPPRFDIATDTSDNGSLSLTFDNLILQAGTATAVFVAASDSGGTRGTPSLTIPGVTTASTVNSLQPSSNELLTTETGENTFLTEWNKTFASSSGGQGGNESLLYQGDPQLGVKHYSKLRFNVGSTLAGKTITDVKLRMRNLHSWWNSGMTVRIGTHTTSTKPSGTSSSSGHFNQWTFDWGKGVQKEVDLPNSNVGEALRDGVITGLTLGRTGQGDINDYGYFDGTGSDRPRLRISWSQTVTRENPVGLFASGRRVTAGTQSGNASYSLSSSGGTLSGVGIQLAIETITDEDLFIDDSVSAMVSQTETDNIGLGMSELQSLPGDQAVPGSDTLAFVENEISLEGVVATDTDTLFIGELDRPPLDEFSVVFNDNPSNPGFVVTVRGLLGIDQQYELIDVFRRDISGRYPDQRVRGLAEIVPQQNEMRVTDYEAPLNTVLQYYVRLKQVGGGTLDLGPAIPVPDPYIPVQDTYGEGLAYFKPIDMPALGIPVQIEEMDEWTRPARILASHDVLGRRNKVIVSDVRGGREGSITGWIWTPRSYPVELFEAVIDPGAVILIQNPNPAASGFNDMYVQVQDVSFQRVTKMARFGLLDNPGSLGDVLIRFSMNYVQVDRPSPIGIVLINDTWGVVNQSFATWEDVKDTRTTWLELLKRPIGPLGLDESSS